MNLKLRVDAQAALRSDKLDDLLVLLDMTGIGKQEQIERAAVEKGDPESLLYRENARLIIGAIRRFAQRYARAASWFPARSAARA